MINKTIGGAKTIKFTIHDDKIAAGRICLYLIKNELHQEPYGLIEDLYVEEKHRGKGHGKKLIAAALEEAKKQGCYKVLATSRHSRENVHKLYKSFGFKEHGIEFRLDMK